MSNLAPIFAAIPGHKGSLNSSGVPRLDEAIRAAIVEAIRRSHKSREQIVEEMSVLAGAHVSVFQLNSWTAPSRGVSRFPAFLIPVFCAVTGDDHLQRLLLSAELLAVLEAGERDLAELFLRWWRARESSSAFSSGSGERESR